MEDRFRELREAGELSGLPGEGVPLPPDPDEGAGDAWAARHVVRTSRGATAWTELRRDVADERGRLVTRLRTHLAWLSAREALLRRTPAEGILREREATRAVDERVREEIAVAIDAVNALAARHDLMVPLALHLPRLSVERLFELARAARREAS